MARRPTSHYLTERISQRDGDWLSTSARQYDYESMTWASRATISGTLTSSNCPVIDSRRVSRIASILTST